MTRRWLQCEEDRDKREQREKEKHDYRRRKQVGVMEFELKTSLKITVAPCLASLVRSLIKVEM